MAQKVTSEVAAAIAAEYATNSNPVLAKRHGVTVSWLEAYARRTGLKKTVNVCFPDLKIGSEVGDLVVEQKTDRRVKSNVIYICRCKCGAECSVRATNLRRNRTTACPKCSVERHVGREHHRRGGHGPISGYQWSKIKSHAYERGIRFEVTIEEAVAIYERQGGLCALTGLPITFPIRSKDVGSGTASLDRIDSSCHYIAQNVRWLHKSINLMKNKMSDDQFIYFCTLVASTSTHINGTTQ